VQPGASVPLSASRFAWLSSPSFVLCVAGLVLPNMLSLGAFLMGIGAPPRTAAIVAYATVAIAARIMPWPVTVILFLAATAYDAIATIARSFNLAPHEVGMALHLSAELNLFASPLYAALCVSLAVLTVANIVLLVVKRDILRRGNPVVLMGAALVFAAGDFAVNASPHYHFGTLYSTGRPMESAIDSSGFNRAVADDSSRRNVLVVVVEALGQFADSEHEAFLLRSFDDTDLRKRYEVSIGTTTYYGSTTAAELRELCETREPYADIIEGLQLDCLPHRMAARGYRTVALHGFTRTFFERELWYPRIGFQTMIFGEDLVRTMPRRCGGGPFRGLCDLDLVPLIARELRNATQPTFIYWLTLSTHVPIAPREGTPQLGCDQGGPMHHVEVCYTAEMWADLMGSLARLTADIPPTDILIVGDHAPPLWSKAGRRLFTPGKVPWVRLTPREASRLSALPGR
jgi:hypothetical protein